MKCIRCQQDCTYPQRKKKLCPNCKGEFAFEPRDGEMFSDAAFLASIQSVSEHGKLKWNYDHLYYELCRRKRPKRATFTAVIVLTFVTVVFLILTASFSVTNEVALCVFLTLTMFTSLILAICLLTRMRSKTVTISHKKFDKMFRRWSETHGIPDGLIPPPDLARREPTRELESDLADYSFDRAVICDRPETVAFLLANQFHFENNCAILTFDGYPPGPFETVREMLKRNPDLRVYVLHDATIPGCMLAQRLLDDPLWFGEHTVKIIDVGLRPAHATDYFDGLMLPRSGARADDVEGIRENEIEFLNRYVMRIETIRPAHIIKRLFLAINRAESNETTEVGAGTSTGGYFPILIPLSGTDTTEQPPPKTGGGETTITYDSSSFNPDTPATDTGGGGGADSFG